MGIQLLRRDPLGKNRSITSPPAILTCIRSCPRGRPGNGVLEVVSTATISVPPLANPALKAGTGTFNFGCTMISASWLLASLWPSEPPNSKTIKPSNAAFRAATMALKRSRVCFTKTGPYRTVRFDSHSAAGPRSRRVKLVIYNRRFGSPPERLLRSGATEIGMFGGLGADSGY
jgi:hypothetical protein